MGLGAAQRRGIGETPDLARSPPYIEPRPETGPAGARFLGRVEQRSRTLQVLELVIFAALAAVVLFQLYAVLGRRVGRQPEDAANGEPARPAELERRRPEDPVAPADGAPLTGVAAIRARDPSFDAGSFVAGARAA